MNSQTHDSLHVFDLASSRDPLNSTNLDESFDVRDGDASIQHLYFRIGALVLVFLFSVIGVAPASMGCIATTSATGEYTDNLYILRSFTAGVMLALSTVHVIADSFEDLNGLAGGYPVASLFVIGGVYLMNAAENILFIGFHHQTASEFDYDFLVEEPSPPCLIDAHDHEISNDREHIAGLLSSGVVCDGELGLTGPSPASVASGIEGGRRVAIAHLMEAGIVVHSIIIGMDLGALDGHEASIAALTTANCLHQLFEGVGLGACIASAGSRLSRRRRLAMVAVFSLTYPAGGAAGIALTSVDAFKAGGVAAGALNGLSGGLLLYMSLVSLLAEDMARSDLRRKGRAWLRCKMQLSMLVGSAIMASLALWS